MKDKLEDFLLSCSEIDFGDVNIPQGEKEFCTELNNELILLCKYLPESTQTDALLFLMRYLRTPFGQELNFFRYYYVPSWSIIYWLIKSTPEDKNLDQKVAKNAHSMAMFLHALDDHLNDNELPVTHLAMLLRSQSWMIMNDAFDKLAHRVDGGEQIVKGFIDDYYSSIRSSKEIESFESHCALFRKQMATWLIVPVLMTKMMTTDEEFTHAIQTAYGSFGIAWRLLDDIRDIETDMMKGTHSSIYICLPEDMKNLWDKVTREKIDGNSDCAEVILDYLLENNVIDRVRARICSELESAASIVDSHNMTDLADEFLCLLNPLKNRQNHL